MAKYYQCMRSKGLNYKVAGNPAMLSLLCFEEDGMFRKCEYILTRWSCRCIALHSRRVSPLGASNCRLLSPSGLLLEFNSKGLIAMIKRYSICWYFLQASPWQLFFAKHASVIHDFFERNIAYASYGMFADIHVTFELELLNNTESLRDLPG